MQRWSQVRSKEHSSMSGGKARGGGESWHGRGAASGLFPSCPTCSSKLRATLGRSGIQHCYPSRVQNQIALGIQHRDAPEPCAPSLPPSLQAPPHPLHQHSPATSSRSPSAPQTGQTGPASCPCHGRAARAPGCCPCRAGRDQEDAREGSGMLCGQVLPRGRCQQCVLGPAGTSLGQGGPGWEVNPTWWAGASFHWLH